MLQNYTFLNAFQRLSRVYTRVGLMQDKTNRRVLEMNSFGDLQHFHFVEKFEN